MANNFLICDNAPDQPLDFLSPNGFLFSIRKCPGVNFDCQTVNIPGLSYPPPMNGNPFNNLHNPGDHLMFEDLSVTFKVDSQMRNYAEIYNWIRQIGFPEDYSERREIAYKPKGFGLKSDATILVLSASKHPIYECVIKDAMPVSLGSIVFTTVSPDVQYVTATAVFKYTNYVLNSLS